MQVSKRQLATFRRKWNMWEEKWRKASALLKETEYLLNVRLSMLNTARKGRATKAVSAPSRKLQDSGGMGDGRWAMTGIYVSLYF